VDNVIFVHLDLYQTLTERVLSWHQRREGQAPRLLGLSRQSDDARLLLYDTIACCVVIRLAGIFSPSITISLSLKALPLSLPFNIISNIIQRGGSNIIQRGGGFIDEALVSS
jgi:hypothetical protein